MFLLLFGAQISTGPNLFKNNNKNNFVIRSVEICGNLQKFRNNTMSNNGLIIENMDLSHIHLAVKITQPCR